MTEILELIKLRVKELKITDNTLLMLIESLEKKVKLYENIEQCLYDSALYLVYKHTTPDGKIYIGITQNHPQTRWNEGGGYEKQSKFYRAIQKYGWINIKHEIIAAGLSEKEAKELENALIIETKSYDAAIGYNTRYFTPIPADTSEFPENMVAVRTGKPAKSTIDIAKEIIEKLSVKFVNGELYYLIDGALVLEKENPILQKTLLNHYCLPLKKHKEIIRQIEILSFENKANLTDEELLQTKMISDSIAMWIKEKKIEIENIPTCVLYDDYFEWSVLSKIEKPKGKKCFFKHIEEKYGVVRKQKSDGKRYFIKLK